MIKEYIARMKESHAHAIEMKEKDIQRYRKTHIDHEKKFKQLGDKYQYTKNELAKTKSELEDEKQRSTAREQEAFESRSQLSTLQEELAAAIEKIKLGEQERDAFKAAAKSEEVLRIAAEGRIPLPKPTEEDDEFRSPKKVSAPLPKVEIVSSEASEEEIELLKDQLERERHRAEAAFDLVDFLTLECQFRCCSCRHGGKTEITYAHEAMAILTEPVHNAPASSLSADMMEDVEMGGVNHDDAMEVDPSTAAESYENRTSTIFVPSEGIFRTVPSRSSQQPQQAPPPTKHRYSTEQMPPPPFTYPRDVNRSSISSRGRQSPAHNNRFKARTPSAEPPAYANNNLLPGDASILSLVSPATSAAPSPKDNQLRATSRQRNEQRYAETQNHSNCRRELGGTEVNGGQQQEGQDQQLPDNNVISQHSSQHSQPLQFQWRAEDLRERPADLDAGRFEYREKDKSMGQESRTQKFEIEHRAYGREERDALKPPPFDHHLHRRNGPVNEDAVDVEMGDAPVMQQREQISMAPPPFTHHIHRPEEDVRHAPEQEDQPVRREAVWGERIRPIRPPLVPKRASPSVEAQVSQQHSQHSQHQKKENEHRERERNFRTISTTTKIAIKNEEDDEDRPPLSAISHHSGAEFGLQRSGSTLSSASEPTLPTGNLPVSREEALAMIRERRGRARSLHQGDAPKEDGRNKSRPPTRQEAPKTPKREISQGPVKSTSQRNARSVSRGRLHGL